MNISHNIVDSTSFWTEGMTPRRFTRTSMNTSISFRSSSGRRWVIREGLRKMASRSAPGECLSSQEELSMNTGEQNMPASRYAERKNKPSFLAIMTKSCSSSAIVATPISKTDTENTARRYRTAPSIRN